MERPDNSELSQNKHKPVVFIASSSEARDRNLLADVGDAVDPDLFAILPWPSAFPTGQYTLETIQEIARKVDYAIFIFAKDDQVVQIDRHLLPQQQKTRDNVVFELGFFLSVLGREKIGLLVEEGNTIPTDLLGFTHIRFRDDGEKGNRPEQIRRKIRDLQHTWQRQSSASSGLLAALLALEKDISRDLERLRAAERPSRRLERPIRFGTSKHCIDTYVRALDLTNERFWTTTFIFSGFWAGDDLQRVLNVNFRLLKRIKPGGVRRLFLLEEAIATEVANLHSTLRNLRRQGKEQLVERKLASLERVKEDVRTLERRGCEVRVVHDSTGASSRLPGQMRRDFSSEKTELAIYDRKRIDLFRNSGNSSLDELVVFDRRIRHFADHLGAAERYFNELWGSSIDAEDFFERLDYTISRFKRRIDYKSNWIARYEFALPARDEELKSSEMDFAIGILKKKGLWGNVQSYLDIGTCTARYPRRFRPAMAESGKIIGLDEDRDCVDFSRSMVDEELQRENPNRVNIDILERDFLSPGDLQLGGPFDIVTCMLGTVSHFNHDQTAVGIRLAFSRVSELLRPGGFFLLSLWSKIACERLDMLSIYSKQDSKRLAQWTPSRRLVLDTLRPLSLEVVEEVEIHERIRFFVCVKKNYQ